MGVKLKEFALLSRLRNVLADVVAVLGESRNNLPAKLLACTFMGGLPSLLPLSQDYSKVFLCSLLKKKCILIRMQNRHGRLERNINSMRYFIYGTFENPVEGCVKPKV